MDLVELALRAVQTLLCRESVVVQSVGPAPALLPAADDIRSQTVNHQNNMRHTDII